MKIQFDIPPGSAQEANGLPVRYATAKRQVPRWRWYLLLAMVLAPPAYLLMRFAVAYWWETAPGFVVTEQVAVGVHTSGRVARIAAVGETVPAGQPVMSLEPPLAGTMPASVAPLAPIAAADPGVAKAVAQGQAARLAGLKEAERLARQQAALHQERVRTMEGLRLQGAATRQELDGVRLQALQAQAGVDRARADLAENAAQVARDQALTLAALRAQGQGAPGSATGTNAATGLPASGASVLPPDVVAPFEATVVRQLVRRGEWVVPGTDVAVLQGRGAPMVHAYVLPDEARYAQVGRQAMLQFMDGGRIRAEVVGVVAEAERIPAERVSPLSPRMPSIVVRLRPLEPLPAAYRIHQLPMDVRFDWVWSGF
ncbi:HlyD family efflux transporter periplasmic adaptor subunit [Acidovorax sp. SUPP3334]|uniref:HlyD family secretion protein n=1 Tax=Acidovorax sp. SUPP3334 TaxID=2920881 RepID=UPI0023DE5290|nr:HlyD family efflux transporter periplasmic adaptor subunit [Acidovorax sp. SUPP3334]GKT21072.1 HlyD family secretion protein [Acidovorax sp. SUPP3334]